MSQFILGIDNGGTSSKAVLFDLSGNVIATSKQNTPMETPKSGHTERDMEALWNINCEVIREVIEEAQISGSDILGISFSGHGKGLYLWGKDDKPVRPGIVSTDTRAYDYVNNWYHDGTAEAVFEKTYQSILACQPVSLLRWLMENEPDVLERAQWIFGVKDYIRYRMTGEAHGEITDFSGSNLVNLKTASYDLELLKLFDLQDCRDMLPPLVYSSDFCGTVTEECARRTGLKTGTPVAAGLFDIDACAIAMDVTSEDKLAVIAGTWSINEYISHTPVLNHSIKMNSLFCLSGYYLVEECSPTSAANLEWVINQFLTSDAGQSVKNIYELVNEMVETVRPNDQNIVFLPYLFGSNDNPQAKACFVGMDSHHTQAQILRSVYEGIVFCHKVHIERLLKNRPMPSAIRIAGGVVNSPIWVQIFADILELPIETIVAKELGALGAAMTAAVAAGQFHDLLEAAKAMVQVDRTYYPNLRNADVYRKKYQLYKRVSESLENCWNEFYD